MYYPFEQFLKDQIKAESSSLSCTVTDDNGVRICANGHTWLVKENTMTSLDKPKTAEAAAAKSA